VNTSENDKPLVESVFHFPPFQNLEQEDKIKLSKLLNFFSTKSMDEISEKNKIIFLVKGKVEAKHSFKDKFTHVYNPGEVINEIAFYNTKYPPISLTALNFVKGFYIDPDQLQTFEKEHTLTAFNILQSFLKNISRHLRKLLNYAFNFAQSITKVITKYNI
jgi:CRP-like cAMP-binding protein